MTTLRAAAQQALEALEDMLSGDLTPYQAAKTSAALEAALAEPVEPVAWDGRCVLGHCGLPSGCEDDGCCRAIKQAHSIGSKT